MDSKAFYKKGRMILKGRLAGCARELSDDGQAQLARIIDMVFNHNHNGDYLSLSHDDPCRVSYATKPEFRYSQKRRTVTTLLRYTQRRLGITVVGSDGHRLAEAFKPFDCRFEICSWLDIQHHYGELEIPGSCMYERADHVAIYTGDPDKVQLLHTHVPPTRALLWTTDEGVKLMDRIYPVDGPHISQYRDWAEANGYEARSPVTDTWEDDHQVTLPYPHNGMYPYTDTFLTATQTSHGVILHTDDCSGTRLDDYEHGNFGSEDLGYCERCSSSVPEDDLYWVDRENRSVCESCANRYYTRCGTCDELIPDDDIQSTVTGASICFHCVECNGYPICDDCGKVDTEYGGYVMHDGDYRCEDCAGDIVSCPGCDENFPLDKTTAGSDGERRCPDCNDTYEADQEEEWI